jgi:hypothetical protein
MPWVTMAAGTLIRLAMTPMNSRPPAIPNRPEITAPMAAAIMMRILAWIVLSPRELGFD